MLGPIMLAHPDDCTSTVLTLRQQCSVSEGESHCTSMLPLKKDTKGSLGEKQIALHQCLIPQNTSNLCVV